ncbi:MAG: hypothetical protein QUU85_08915, partial [Candidatus Eisenbacteria bacterium]|nr:hypothetical protein [Candidatus Eisenbacteria bacterium]
MLSDRTRLVRGLVLALALLAAVAGGAAFTRHLVLDRAARVLAGWQDAGLPGSAPRGDGPRLVGIWPPRLRWDDVTWTDSGGATLRCDHLVLEIEPSRLFGRSLRLRAISVSQLEWETSPPRSRWISPFLASLPSQEPPGLEDPPPRAIRFSIDGFRIAPGPLEIGSLEGWAASPRRGSWSLRARGSTPEGRGWSIRGMGSGYRGEANLTLETVLGPDRSLQIGLARTGVATASDAAASDAEATGDHATGDQATGDQATGDQVVGDKRWSWDLTARDDGTLLTSLLADPLTCLLYTSDAADEFR